MKKTIAILLALVLTLGAVSCGSKPSEGNNSDTSADTLNIDSKILLEKTCELIASKGYEVGNIDATICAERPKMNPHIPAMKACLARVMKVEEDQISIKATTTERLGFTGREEGISAYATVLIGKREMA